MMNNFLLLVPPVVWPKLPLIGPAYILEYLNLHNIKTYFKDLNVYIYSLFKNKNKDKMNWTGNYHYFAESFFHTILKEYPHYIHDLISFIKKNSIHTIGFSVYKTNYLFSLNLAQFIKESMSEVKIIFGGPQISYLHHYNPDYFSLPSIDYFIVGEGEKVILEILQGKIKKKIIYPEQIIQLDQLPFPKYNDFELTHYERKNALPLLFSRGCINQCQFCFEKMEFPYYATHSPEYLIEEMKYHIKKNNIHWFTFYDSLFNGHLPKLKKLLELIIRDNLKIIWDAQISIRNDMDNELFQLFKESGCINLFIGLESGSPEILKRINKNFTLSMAQEFFRKLNHFKINFEISLILNYPFENENNFHETINFIIHNKNVIKKIAQMNPFIYYPGTKTEITQGYNFYAGLNKVKRLTDMLTEHNIATTKAYINNLIN